MRAITTLAGWVTASLVVTGCAASVPQAVTTPTPVPPTPTPAPYTPAPEPTKEIPMIRTVVDICKASGKSKISDNMHYVKVYDGGRTAVVDTRNEYAEISGVACFLFGIDTPRSVIARIDSTTSLQGEVRAKTDDYTYAWTYHPDNGLNLVVEER